MAPISFLQPTQTVCADNNVCNACCKRYKIKLNYCQGQKDVCSFKLGRSFEYSIYLPTNLFNADTKKPLSVFFLTYTKQLISSHPSKSVIKIKWWIIAVMTVSPWF